MLTTACVLAVLVTVSAELASAATMQSGPVTYVKQTLGISPSTAGISTAACPENRPLSGGGVSWNVKAPGFDELDIGEIYGFDGADVGSIVDDGYRAYAINAGAKARDLTTWAACIKNSPPLINYTTTNYTMPATIGSGVDTASCFSGEVMGGGLNTNAPTADVVEFEAFHPKFDGAKLAPTEVTFALSKIGAAGAIDYTVQRFCSDANLKHVYRTTVTFTNVVATVKAPCPKGTRVVGGGFGYFPSDLLGSVPYDGGDKDKAPDDGWKIRLRDSTSVPQSNYVTASCLK